MAIAEGNEIQLVVGGARFFVQATPSPPDPIPPIPPIAIPPVPIPPVAIAHQVVQVRGLPHTRCGVISMEGVSADLLPNPDADPTGRAPQEGADLHDPAASGSPSGSSTLAACLVDSNVEVEFAPSVQEEEEAAAVAAAAEAAEVAAAAEAAEAAAAAEAAEAAEAATAMEAAEQAAKAANAADMRRDASARGRHVA